MGSLSPLSYKCIYTLPSFRAPKSTCESLLTALLFLPNQRFLRFLTCFWAFLLGFTFCIVDFVSASQTDMKKTILILISLIPDRTPENAGNGVSKGPYFKISPSLPALGSEQGKICCGSVALKNFTTHTDFSVKLSFGQKVLLECRK